MPNTAGTTERNVEKAKNATHTPGPWHAQETVMGETIEIRRMRDEADDEFEEVIADISVKEAGSYGEAWANARLIAAAPDLLEALNEAQEALDVLAQDAEEAGYPQRADNATAMAMRFRAAIAKASGVES